MGSVCSCGKSKTSSTNNLNEPTSKNKTKLPDVPDTTTNIHSTKEILDDKLKAGNTGIINEHSVPNNPFDKEDETTEVLKSVRPLSSALPETTTNIHSSSEVAADNLKAEFNEALDEHSVPTSTTDNNVHGVPGVSESNETQLSAVPKTTANISSSQEFPVDSLKTENAGIVNGQSVPNDTLNKTESEAPLLSELNKTQSSDEPDTTANTQSTSENPEDNLKASNTGENNASNNATDKNESEVPVSSKAEAVDEPETTVNNHSSQENDNDDSKTRNTDENESEASKASEPNKTGSSAEPETTANNHSSQENVNDNSKTHNTGDAGENKASDENETETSVAGDTTKKIGLSQENIDKTQNNEVNDEKNVAT